MQEKKQDKPVMREQEIMKGEINVNSKDESKADITAMIEKIKEEAPMKVFSNKEQWMPPFYKKMQKYLKRENRRRGISITIEFFD